MSLSDALTLVAGVAASFGLGAGVVLVLSGYLGDWWAKRALQKEAAKLQEKLEELKHEFGLTRSSYENHVSLILDYFDMFYRHYRLCQRVANADAYRQPEGGISRTKQEYLDTLDTFMAEWAQHEGKIRLILPEGVLKIHEQSVECFNIFTKAVKNFQGTDETRDAKRAAFAQIELVKVELERTLRQFLRTERLFK